METHIAWAAGLFEGEGYFDINNGYLRLCIEMTDRDVLERFESIFPGGTWTTRKRKEHWKQTYTYRINRKSFSKHALVKMLPFFGQRRAYKALNILDDLEINC